MNCPGQCRSGKCPLQRSAKKLPQIIQKVAPITMAAFKDILLLSCDCSNDSRVTAPCPPGLRGTGALGGTGTSFMSVEECY